MSGVANSAKAPSRFAFLPTHSGVPSKECIQFIFHMEPDHLLLGMEQKELSLSPLPYKLDTNGSQWETDGF